MEDSGLTFIDPQIWVILEASQPIGQNLNSRLAVNDPNSRLLCAMDSNRNRHLLIPLENNEDGYEDSNSRGLNVITHDLRIHDHPLRQYIDISCRDSSGYLIFDLIAFEIATEIARMRRSPAEIVQNVIKKWRRFWGQLPQNILSYENQIGLFAEIWFMTYWLIPCAGITEALHRWRGPSGSRHDFEWPGYSVEVKATTSKRGKIHRIHGIDQLDPPENGILSLFSLSLREEAGAGNTLTGLVTVCRHEIEFDPDLLEIFESNLFRVGYSPLHEAEYAKNHYRIINESLFSVSGDFPRLNAGTIDGGIPAGVERVDYEINLNSFDHLIIAHNPTEFNNCFSS
jgi:hypothetical protein